MPGEIITLDSPTDVELWNNVVSGSAEHDTYHTAEYHLAAEDNGEGKALLLVVTGNSGFVALPLLVRPLDRLPGSPGCQNHDATSVYGYGGPVTSAASGSRQEKVDAELSSGLLDLMRQLNLVAVFTRLHPLVDTAWVLEPIGKIKRIGPTVLIDLTQTAEDQTRGMRQNYRRVVRKMQKQGVSVFEDADWSQLNEFEKGYAETMTRVAAESGYFFSDKYFSNLRDRLGKKVRLFHATLEGKIIGSALFFVHNGIIQYHLGATRDGYHRYSPTAIIFDFLRWWGKDNGYRYFHLGGGVEGNEDSVFHFKCGLSKDRREYLSASIVVDQPKYAALCEDRRRLLGDQPDPAAGSRFFPEYRAALPLAYG
jgi:hypothetical protein